MQLNVQYKCTQYVFNIKDEPPTFFQSLYEYNVEGTGIKCTSYFATTVAVGPGKAGILIQYFVNVYKSLQAPSLSLCVCLSLSLPVCACQSLSLSLSLCLTSRKQVPLETELRLKVPSDRLCVWCSVLCPHHAMESMDVVFIILINVKMPTIGGIFTFVSRINSVLSWLEHEVEHKISFINSRPGL